MYINVNILKGIKALNNCNKALMKTKQKSQGSQTLKQKVEPTLNEDYTLQQIN